MKRVWKKKTSKQKLTTLQRQAIKEAKTGNYAPIINCVISCEKAILKAHRASEMGVPGWGQPMMVHWIEIRDYLISLIDKEEIITMLNKIRTKMEDNSNG